MSICIETDLSLICSAFNINASKLTHEYSGMSINQIMEEEAANGNALASQFTEELLSSPDKLIEFIQLNNPSNKYAILSHMNENDLREMIPFLESEDMILGLNFFTQEKLVDMIAFLPSDQAALLSLQMFSPEHLMYLMPKESINMVLASKELQDKRGLELACVATLPPEILAQMIEAVTGEIPIGFKGYDLAGNASFDNKALMAQISGFDKETFQESLFAIPPAHKKLFMTAMVQEEPKIWTMFQSSDFAGIISYKKHKDEIIRSANVIAPVQLMNMTAQLPKELLSVVLTQVDTEEFAKMLQKEFRDVIGELAIS